MNNGFLKILKVTNLIFFVSFSLVIYSCNFNITDNPGSQVSSSIESSKKHKAFICAYKIDSPTKNGIEVESIFAEKKYWLNEGLFGKFKINCCESQLIIIFKDNSNITTLNGMSQNWTIQNFTSYRSNIIIKNYQTIKFEDSIHIRVIPEVNNLQSFTELSLHKI